MAPQAPHSGAYSLELYALDGSTGTAGVDIQVGDISFDQITELSYWKYIESFTGGWGFNPIVILGIDANGDGVLDFDIEDAMLVYAMLSELPNQPSEDILLTILGDDVLLTIESTTGEAPYPTEPDTDWGEVDVLVGDPENLDYPLCMIGYDKNGYLGEVYHWADFTGFGLIELTDNVKLIGLGLDTPSNQIVYVDDITINGVTYDLEPSSATDVLVDIPSIVAISVTPTSIDFGTLSPGQSSSETTLTVENIGTTTVDVGASLEMPETVFVNLELGGTIIGEWTGILGLLGKASSEVAVQLVVPSNYSAKGPEANTIIFSVTPQ